ncbi:MAG: DUF92 domain-containing protein [Pedobacter sp.]|nr:MAG: DUF92 domain-containing protein [Pedobacter sp.]
MVAFRIDEIVLPAFLVVLMFFCYKFKKLTLKGSLAAGVVGFAVYLADHYRGLLLLLVFFILSVLATSHKKALKSRITRQASQRNPQLGQTDPQASQANPQKFQEGGRTAAQVFANGGVAAICALLGVADPQHLPIYLMMLACSLASALADTLSSELGIVYGRRFYNVLTLKQDSNGLDGVVSFEGTLIGAIGAFIVGVSFAGFSIIAVLIGIAGIIGNFSDSVIGASLERKGIVGNNFVNFLNTFIAAIVGLLTFALLL